MRRSKPQGHSTFELRKFLAAVLALVFSSLAFAEELPPLEELQKVRWRLQFCAHPLEHLRRALEKRPPEATEEEALSMENADEETNRKILSALGRLPRSDDEVDWDATFNRYTGSDPNTLNPLFNSSRYEFWIEDLIFVAPLGIDWELRPFGNLDAIETWESSEDGSMDRIVLRRDLEWSDGKPLTARDVEFTFRLFSDPKIRASARRTMIESLRAVKAYDDFTVIYFHKEPRITNSLSIAFPILPRHALERELEKDPTLEGAAFNQKPVTCGPYVLVHWKPREEILLRRNERWYQGENGREIRAKPFFLQLRFRPYPDSRTRFLSFLAGETDDTQLDSEQWLGSTRTEPKFRARAVKVRCEEASIAFVAWNALSRPPNPFFGDRRVRLAMALALNHEHLRDHVFYGMYRPGLGIFHPDSWMAAKGLQPLRRDIQRAAALLEESGWIDSDGDGIRDKIIDGVKVPFRFTLSLAAAGTGPKVARQLAADLEVVGVRCEVQLMDWVTFQQAVGERRVQAFIMQMGQGADPDTAWNLWHSEAIESGRNSVGYSNPRVDELFRRGRVEFDPAKRAEIYQEIDRTIYEDQPITILVYPPSLWAFSKSVRGYHPSLKCFFGLAPGFQSLWKKRVSGGSEAAAEHPDYTVGLLLGLAAAAVFFVVLYAVARAASRAGPARP